MLNPPRFFILPNEILVKVLLIFMLALPFQANAESSTCYGTTSDGRLENGVQLPASGINYEGYSTIARIVGRTYVHSGVKEIIINAYKKLEIELPDKVFKYAETGFENGGRFKPHKTHRNGLSVDFMTPVMNSDGKSVHLPTSPLNKFGYNIEFDQESHYQGLSIDYEALAAHIVILHKEAELSGHGLWRVIFDPDLQPRLFETRYADYLQNNISFSKKPSWVRHDEHYHVDFLIQCEK